MMMASSEEAYDLGEQTPDLRTLASRLLGTLGSVMSMDDTRELAGGTTRIAL